MIIVEAIIMVVFPFAMIYAAFSDAFTMTIANRISLLLIASFLAVSPFIGLSIFGFGMHLLAFATVLAVTFTLFQLGTMGGGDAKLLASTSLWIGWSPLLMEYLVITAIVGGMLTVTLMAFRGSNAAAVASEVPQLKLLATAKKIPYGIALGLGGLWVFPFTPAMQWVILQFAL
ncbi:MAG: prepilin peptidase [Pseudomonadota bacterium]